MSAYCGTATQLIVHNGYYNVTHAQHITVFVAYNLATVDFRKSLEKGKSL